MLHWTRSASLAWALFGCLVVGGCRDSGSGSATQAARQTDAVASPGEAPRRILRVGDQLKILQTSLHAAGEDQPSGYRIEWANFIGGPPVIAAETGGSVDLGWMMETPLVFAQAAGSPVKVVAVGRHTAPGASALAIVVKPAASIQAVADLKGRSVGFIPGTSAHYLVVKALARAGLTLRDIHPVFLANVSSELLEQGTLDATVAADPVLAQDLKRGTVRLLVRGGAPLTPDLYYLVASDAALRDDSRVALVSDFVQRVARAARWQRTHVQEAAKTFAHVYNVSPEVAADVLSQDAIRYGPLGGLTISEHQDEADTFERLGLIRTHLDAAKLFDRRFDPVLAKADGDS